MLSFLAMQLSAAIGALGVAPVGVRCKNNHARETEREQPFSEHTVSFHNKISCAVHRELLFIHRFTQQDR